MDEREGNAAKTKIGQLFLSRGGQPEHVRVELGRDELRVSRHDMVLEDTVATKELVGRRTVELVRSEQGWGIAIKGGVDFKLPVSIDTVFDNSPASESGEIHADDVLMMVNGESVWGKTHEETADLLRSAGPTVTLILCKMQDKDVSVVVGEAREDEEGEEDCFIEFISLPLEMATVSIYANSTAINRPNSFQVISSDERKKVTLHCDETKHRQLQDWIDAIRYNISLLQSQKLLELNAEREEDNKIELMGWVHELLSSTPHSKVWRRKFLVLQKSQLEIFDSLPTDVHEWLRPVHIHKLIEITSRVLKPHELENQRDNSLLLSSGKGYTHIISFDTRQSLREWTTSIHRFTVAQVTSIQSIQFPGRWKQKDIDFCLDLGQGFIIRERDTLMVKWKRPFSWLRSSSDDNHSWLKLQFVKPHSRNTESHEVMLEDLHLAVVAMESFILTKLTTFDPGYINTQSDYVPEPSP